MNRLHPATNCATLITDELSPDTIVISRQDLETEHRQLLSRLHQIRRLLGYPELQTGQKQRQHGNHIG